MQLVSRSTESLHLSLQDTVRDVRGFATKFYTKEGNWDIVGNNIPVFFIQDAIKFPDIVHALKPEPHNDCPTGQTAHNNFWDFVSLTPEGMHSLISIKQFADLLLSSDSYGSVGNV